MNVQKIELAAFILLGIGAVLLLLTFYMAFTLIVADLSTLSALDLSEAIGEAIGPIAEAVIKVMYLVVMGWIGSIATIRGVQLLREAKRVPQSEAESVREPSLEKKGKTEKD